MDRKLPKRPRDVGRNLGGKRKRRREQLRRQLINKRVPYISFSNDLNLIVKTWPLLVRQLKSGCRTGPEPDP